MINKSIKLQLPKRWLALALTIGMIAVIVLPAGMVSAVGPNLALNRPAVSSSMEGTGFEAGKAVDGSGTTRWASVEPAPNAEWIYVDLGSTTAIGEVILKWEAAYGKSYQVQTSNDAVSWTTIYTTTTGDGATDDLVISGSGRYVRVYMTVRGTAYGYSLYELEVYGTGGPTPTNTAVGPTATRTNTPVGPTATPTRTNTSVPATATRTNTPAIPTATSVSTGNGSVWMGHNRNITNGGLAGVAPVRPSDIFVDANGYLHMKITNSGGSWTAAETFTQDKIGFGTYQWQIEGNVDNMDKATVLGLFPYGPVAGIGGDGEDEIDIELSKWNNTCSCNADFTFWPATGHGNLGPAEDLFNFSLGGGNLVTARFVWRSNSIVGYVMSGLVPIGNAPTNILATFTFTPTDYTSRIPQVALPLGINFWVFQTTPATNQ